MISELQQEINQVGELEGTVDEAIISDFIRGELRELMGDIEGADIPKGLKKSLSSKVHSAFTRNEKAGEFIVEGREKQARNIFKASANIMRAFMNTVEAQSGKNIPKETAKEFIKKAQQLREKIDKKDVRTIPLTTETENFSTFKKYTKNIRDETEDVRNVANDLKSSGFELQSIKIGDNEIKLRITGSPFLGTVTVTVSAAVASTISLIMGLQFATNAFSINTATQMTSIQSSLVNSPVKVPTGYWSTLNLEEGQWETLLNWKTADTAAKTKIAERLADKGYQAVREQLLEEGLKRLLENIKMALRETDYWDEFFPYSTGADTFVDGRDGPSNNRGAKEKMGATKTADAGLVRFYVSSIEPPFNNVKLKLYSHDYWWTHSTSLSVWPVADDWKEMEVDWYSKPDVTGEKLDTTFQAIPGWWSFHTEDLTEYVEHEILVDDTVSFGIDYRNIYNSFSGVHYGVEFRTKEFSTSKAPRLVIDGKIISTAGTDLDHVEPSEDLQYSEGRSTAENSIR